MKKLTHDLMEMTLRPDWSRATASTANVEPVTVRRSRSESRVDHFSQTSPQNSMEESSVPGQKREIEPTSSPTSVKAPSPVDQRNQQRQQRHRTARGDTQVPPQPDKYTVIPIKVDVNIKFRPKRKTSSSISACSDVDDDKIDKVSERDQVESDISGQHEQQPENVDIDDANDDELKTEHGDVEACVVENNEDA
jgi:hypothetical protein